MSTSRVDVGTPPTQWSNNFEGWKTINVCFHGFADLTTTRGEYVRSPEFSCLGHQWLLALFPGGKADSAEGCVAIILANKSNTSIKISYGFSARDADGKEVVYHKPQTNEFGTLVNNASNNARCRSNFAQRSTIMDILVDGSLVIEVRMKSMSTDKSPTQFIPTNPLCKNVLELFMDEESADVVFEVDNGSSCQSEEHTNKKLKTTTSIYAHRLILKNNASALYEMCGTAGEEGITTVSITDVKPKIFEHMLYYAYGGKLSDIKLKANAKDIINACDKYGVVHLKLEAEAYYVKSSTISMDNIMDNLLYADSKNLALLKEAVMDYILANKGDIIGKVSFNDFPGHLVTDLLTAVARGEETGEGDRTDYNKMRVGTLRKMLDEKGLDVDGSREAMVALLKDESA